jgi:hypothetical protein
MATVTPATDALNFVAGLATTTSAKKDTKPVIQVPELAESIETYIVRKAEADTAQALADAAKDQIVAAVGPKRLELCVRAGKVISSVSVNRRLTFTQTSRYSTVPEARKEALAEAFGDSFGRYFQSTLAISLKRQSANDEQVLTELVSALGPEFFQAHFDVRRDLLVQDAFHNDFTTRSEVQELAQPFFEEQTIRPYSPSLKVS